MNLLTRYRGSLLLAILAFSFVTRILYVHLPENYYFDEVYHSVTAGLIAENDPSAFEWWSPPPEPDTAVDWLHPPIAKYFQAASVSMFGANSFGYRFSSVVFGVLVVALTYHVAKRLFKSSRLGLLAAALASFDGLLLVQSRIAMNDIHLTAFVLFSVWMFLIYTEKKELKWLFFTGIATGLTVATKWSGIFLLPTFALWSATDWLATGKEIFWKKTAQWFLYLLLVPTLVYVASYSLMFAQGKDWDHFAHLHRQIWWYQTNLTATHPYQSRPWEWVLNTQPVWYHVDYLSDELRGHIYAQGNVPLYWLGLAAVATACWRMARLKFSIMRSDKTGTLSERVQLISQSIIKQPIFPILILYFVFWLPWIFSPRIMFFYHYAPAVPFMCIILAWWMLQAAQYRTGVWLARGLFVLIGIWFVAWYPYWTATPVPVSLIENVYQRFEIWQ